MDSMALGAMGAAVSQPRRDEISAAWATLGSLIRDRALAGSLRVLEAGGGSATHLPMPSGVTPRYTVIDVSAEQLARNTYADERIHGNLETQDYGPRRFDVAVFWDVLEHLDNPAIALSRTVSALAPGGLLVIKGPLPASAKGVITWLTPHVAHVAFYRHVLRDPNAGKPGHAPFPAVLSGDAGPAALSESLVKAGCTVELSLPFVGVHAERLSTRFPLVFAGYRAFAGALRLATASRYGSEETDFLLVASAPR